MKKVIINENYCKGCELCVSVCPKHVLALSHRLNATGYHPAELVDEANCIMCAFCARMCPDAAIEVWKVAEADPPEKERSNG